MNDIDASTLAGLDETRLPRFLSQGNLSSPARPPAVDAEGLTWYGSVELPGLGCTPVRR